MPRRKALPAKRQRSGDIVGIVVEGHKTEKVYLEKFRSLVGVSKSKVVICENSATTLEALVESVPKEIRGRKLRGLLPVDEWWVLGDTEGVESGLEELFRRAYRSRPRINVAINDPAMELWLLLHFQRVTKPYPNARAVRSDLSAYIPAFANPKEKDPHFDVVKDRIRDACANAETLRSDPYIGVDGPPRTDTDLVVRVINNAAIKNNRILDFKQVDPRELALWSASD